ncbi:MAG: hypothetical protein ACREQ5_25780 [Candidatus Dormibacteria bacterium]
MNGPRMSRADDARTADGAEDENIRRLARLLGRERPRSPTGTSCPPPSGTH